MSIIFKCKVFVVICCILIVNYCLARQLLDSDGEFFDVSVTPAEAIRARGYLAQDFKFKTSDGYILNVARGRNPLFAGNETRDPLLFLHGLRTSPAAFLLNSRNVRPQDFRQACYSSQNEAQLLDAVGKDPSAKSFAFLALNCGHEVWILSRRGGLQSEGKDGHLNRTTSQILASIPAALFNFTLIDYFRPYLSLIGFESSDQLTEINEANSPLKSIGLKQSVESQRMEFAHTFDADYWYFTMDQQALIDLPAAVEFVLSKSARDKLIIVGHSEGGAIPLLALSEMSEFFNQRVSKVILWAPALNLGSNTDSIKLLSLIKPAISTTYVGPIPFAFQVRPLKESIRDLCNTSKLTQLTVCRQLQETMGKADQYSYYKKFEYVSEQSIGGNLEMAHLIQFPGSFQPRKYQYKTSQENMNAYGQAEAPIYNLSLINQRGIYLYAGNTDTFVSTEDVRITSSQLTVPHELTVINRTEFNFNHVGYFFHDFTPELAIVPSMWDIIS